MTMSKRGTGQVTTSVVVAAFIVMVVGLSMIPTMAVLTTDGSDSLDNFTSAQSIIELIPLFWSILMLAIPVAAIGLYFAGV